MLHLLQNTNLFLDFVLVFIVTCFLCYQAVIFVHEKIFEWRWNRQTIEQLKERQKQFLKNKNHGKNELATCGQTINPSRN
jgi:hypothetical protein